MRALTLVLLLAIPAACSSTPGVPPQKGAAQQREEARIQVGFVIVDGVYNTELTAPYDIFQHTVFHTEPGMHVFTIAPTKEPVTTFEGLRILPDYSFDNAPSIDVLVVPSGEHSMDADLENPALMDFVRERGARADYVLSLCDGAFVLAAAGLLDGHRATTFPADVASLRTRFSGIEVVADVSFVHDRNVLTSAGGALSFDAALYLAELLYGAKAARGLAQGLCIDWKPQEIAHMAIP